MKAPAPLHNPKPYPATTRDALLPVTAAETEENYLSEEHGLKSWLTTRDHKRIGLLFLFAILFFFTIAAIAAALMRMELITPQSDFLRPVTYNKMFTIHGVLMVWFFLIPSIPSVLGNFVLPLMIGARDLAFPRINLLSWYLLVIGGAIACYSIVVGGVDTGWTFYAPYSTVYSNTHVVTMVVGIFLAGFSSILTGLNFIVTIHKMRAPGMTWSKLPLFVWSLYATSLIMILATPELGITLLMILVERVWHVGIFDPALGGDPVLFQHMFWFYSHPAVYIMILPGMGVVSELIPCFARQRIFGYWFVAGSSMAIGFLGFLVWGHHMFVASQSVYAGFMFSMLSYLVAVPSAIKVFNWTATLHRGSISLETPMLYALGFVGLFTLGGMTGLFLAALGIDVHVTDTYFVIAHFHYIMVGGMVTGFLGGLHYWWPKITGRMYPERLGQLAALVMYIGFNLTFFPMYWMGWLGMPRRYASYPPDFQLYHIMSSAGASILGIGYLMPCIYLTWSLRHGKKAPANPWRATGLEWLTTSPPPKHNFKRPPIVTRPPYDYYPAIEEEVLQEEQLKIQAVKAQLREDQRLTQEDSHAE
jgi:cytochrome c oxidase subunit 1